MRPDKRRGPTREDQPSADDQVAAKLTDASTISPAGDIEQEAALVIGLDGKQYRRRPLDQRTRDYLFGRCRYERYDNGLSMRQIVAALADEGWRVSLGTVAAYLKQECVACSGAANSPPEQQKVDDELRDHSGARRWAIS